MSQLYLDPWLLFPSSLGQTACWKQSFHYQSYDLLLLSMIVCTWTTNRKTSPNVLSNVVFFRYFIWQTQSQKHLFLWTGLLFCPGLFDHDVLCCFSTFFFHEIFLLLFSISQQSVLFFFLATIYFVLCCRLPLFIAIQWRLFCSRWFTCFITSVQPCGDVQTYIACNWAFLGFMEQVEPTWNTVYRPINLDPPSAMVTIYVHTSLCSPLITMTFKLRALCSSVIIFTYSQTSICISVFKKTKT